MTYKTNVTWEEIEHWSDRLAEKIADDCSDLSQATLIAVSRGGLIPAQLVAYKLDIRDIRLMKLVSYDHDNTQKSIQDISTDRLFDGSAVYVIDDLADSGETVKYIRKKLPSARICTLLKKTCCNEHPDICVREGIDKDCWIVFPWD